MQKKELSLRERRREQTWRALHEAALKRVREHGMRGTTVEEIAREAGVSPRTFFNYFPSKEDAVLGLREPVVSEEILETDRLHEDENTIIRVTHLLWQIIFHSFYYIKVKSNDFQTHCREFPDSAKRFKMHHMRCEQVLTEYLNTIDWVAFDAAGRRGPFPRRSPSDP
ncbi:MAG: TetR/AcrR family transcriptional regulator, partial [Rothia mucilaginosa]|nr:TetR/AcrR family transcriptional regulator [Rothia mucilaginosa]